MPYLRPLFPAAALQAAAAVLFLAGCSAQATASGSGSPDPGTPAPVDAYPLELDNCGTAVHMEAPPERVVTIKSTATEMLLALGQGERIVGTAFSDGPVPPDWAPDTEPPVLADKVPSQESVLALEPDLVYAGWESNFAADGAGKREQLGTLGIDTYVSPAACQADGYRPAPLTFDDVFDSITEAGAVFDAREEAAALVARQRSELESVAPDPHGLSALWFSSGSDTPYVGAGSGAPQLMMDAAGLANIASDIDQGWSPFSWEAVAAADPDVIVLVDSPWGSVEKKIAVLESTPVISELPAVQEQRYLVVPFAASEAGVRNVETVRSLVEQLADLG